jgi:hypothetical protein
MKVIKEHLKLFLLNMGALLPTIVFLDMVMGIQLIRDLGWIKTTGFITCLVIYAIGFKYTYKA